MPQTGLTGLKNMYERNPRYFQQFIEDADERAVAVLGPVFGIDAGTWKQFRQQYLGGSQEGFQLCPDCANRLHSSMGAGESRGRSRGGAVSAGRPRGRRPGRRAKSPASKAAPRAAAPAASAASKSTRKAGKRATRRRFSAEERAEMQKAKKLRGDAHQLVLQYAKMRDVSPAVVYGELTNKYGRKMRDAGSSELQNRIEYVKGLVSKVRSQKKPAKKAS